MASRIPALPQESHVQSHAAVHKNKLCDSHALLGPRETAGGWTRTPCGHSRPTAIGQRNLRGKHKRKTWPMAGPSVQTGVRLNSDALLLATTQYQEATDEQRQLTSG
jgi:hypothetical protein